VSLLLEVVHLLMLYRARVMDREKVGQVMFVLVAKSVHYLPPLVQHRPRQDLAMDTFSVRHRGMSCRFGDTDPAPGDTGLLPHVLQ
jgi:hypothetical protein